jgi:hypothetical protein
VPSQSAFESALLAALRELDTERMVWVGDWSVPVAGLTLPPALRDALARAMTVHLTVPCAARAMAWRESLLLQDASVDQVLDGFADLDPAPPKALLRRCRELAERGQAIEALSLLIEDYIDPHYAQRAEGPGLNVMRLASLAPAEVASFVGEWLG